MLAILIILVGVLCFVLAGWSAVPIYFVGLVLGCAIVVDHIKDTVDQGRADDAAAGEMINE